MESRPMSDGTIWYWDLKNKKWVRRGEEIACLCHAGKVCAYCMGLAERES